VGFVSDLFWGKVLMMLIRGFPRMWKVVELSRSLYLCSPLKFFREVCQSRVCYSHLIRFKLEIYVTKSSKFKCFRLFEMKMSEWIGLLMIPLINGNLWYPFVSLNSLITSVGDRESATRKFRDLPDIICGARML
jgi:hypothetical protein